MLFPFSFIHTGIKIATPSAYQSIQMDRCGANSSLTEGLLTLLRQKENVSPQLLSRFVHNDFEFSFFQQFPQWKGKGHLCGSTYLAYEDNGRYCMIPEEKNALWWKDVDHRRFFVDKYSLKGVHSWNKLSLEEKALDEQKRALTKRLLRF